MRVMLVIGLLAGGGSERQLALFAERARHAVTLSGFIVNPGGVWDAAVRSCLVHAYDGGGSYAQKLRAFAEAVRRERPDVIHCWHPQTVVYPLLTWPLHRRPIVVNVRSALSRSTDTAATARPRFVPLLRLASAIVANSAHLLDDLRSIGVEPRRPSVIENGIVVPEQQALHARRGDGVQRLVGIGTLKPLKNWSQLLRVAATLRTQGRAVEVTVFGEGPSMAELKAEAAALGFDPERTFPGFSRDVGAALCAHDLLMHPSRSEGLPNAVLEGLAAGLPAVTSDLGAYAAMRAAGDFVRVHPIDDDAGCLAAMQPWLADADARAAAGSAGRRYIEATYSVDAMVGRFVDVYRGVIA